MPRDRKKLNEYNATYLAKLKRLGVKRLHANPRFPRNIACPKCGIEFNKGDKTHKRRTGSKNNKSTIHYHQECWYDMGY